MASAASVKYTLGFKDLVVIKECKMSQQLLPGLHVEMMVFEIYWAK